MPLPDQMHAIIVKTYGSSDVLEYVKVETPRLTPADKDSVIIKVEGAGVNPVDHKLRSGAVKVIFPLKFPSFLGIDYAGTVAEVGSAVTKFKVGDAVYGKLGTKAMTTGKGTYAEYVKVSTTEDLVVPRPSKLDAVHAAGVGVVALTAYVGLVTYGGLPLTPDGKTRRVLIIGASGGVGVYGVQIAKKLGAEVTAVCSGSNAEMVKSIGADRVIDYKAGPLKAQIAPEGHLAEKDMFDVLLDCVGGDEYWDLAQIVLKPGGLFSTTTGSGKDGVANMMVLASFGASMVWRMATNSRKYKFISYLPLSEFENIAKWIEDGSLKPVTKVTMALQDAKKAHDLSESGKANGKIVLLP
ncbi:hypothetical protein HDU76_004892 [Blyttiomyces sp. JEL0837]|nr:hypothetical protein HDU76_004892 [Blyttiomyces sp. JEL0837]